MFRKKMVMVTGILTAASFYSGRLRRSRQQYRRIGFVFRVGTVGGAITVGGGFRCTDGDFRRIGKCFIPGGRRENERRCDEEDR